MAPVLNFEIYQQAWIWESRQISLDNAAILWGRADRDAMQFLKASNHAVRGMEAVHHLWHACARVPNSALECLPKDLAIEKQLAAIHESARATANLLWQKGSTEATRALVGISLGRLFRLSEPPIHEEICPLCGGAYLWEADHDLKESRVESASKPHLSAGSRLQGTSLLKGESWNYLLTKGNGIEEGL